MNDTAQNFAITLRPSVDDDVARVTEIYAHHVLTGLASFETTPPDAAEVARRRAAVVEQGLPFIVAQIGAPIVGYAYATPYRTRPAYRYTLEDSVYVHRDFVGRGVGRRLLDRLIADCAAGGYRQMIAVIGDSANHRSIALHAACGFARAGVLSAVGFKFGRWVDSVLMQRPLVDSETSLPGGDRDARAP